MPAKGVVMQSYEDLMDDPLARECDFLDLDKSNDDPDNEPLPFSKNVLLLITGAGN